MNKELKKPTWITYMLFGELFLLLVLIDQFTKIMITQTLAFAQMRPIINGFFSFMYVRNTGSAFSMFADKSWGITVLSVISSIAFVLIIGCAFFVLAKYRSRRLSLLLIFHTVLVYQRPSLFAIPKSLPDALRLLTNKCSF